MRRILGRELAVLAQRMEQQFFRIEKDARWGSSVINALIAGSSVGIVAWLAVSFEAELMRLEGGDLLLFACLGSSSASVVFAPVAKTNSLRSIVLAYLASALVCGAMFQMRDAASFPLPVQCFSAVALSVFVMRQLDAMHPAAVGSAMAFIIYERELRSLMLLSLAIIGLLLLIKVLIYTYREELEFRQFHRELRRGYYGTEITLAMVPPKPEDEPETKSTPESVPIGASDSAKRSG